MLERVVMKTSAMSEKDNLRIKVKEEDIEEVDTFFASNGRIESQEYGSKEMCKCAQECIEEQKCFNEDQTRYV